MTRLKQCLWIGGLVFLLSGSAGPSVYPGCYRVYLPAVRGASPEDIPPWWNAQDLTCGQAVQASPNHTDDYYHFRLEERSTVTVTVEDYAPTSTSGTVALYGTAFDKRPEPLITYFGEGGQDSMSLGPCSLEPGKYYVRVYTADNHSDDLYTLKVDCVSFDSDPESPCQTPVLSVPAVSFNWP